MAPFLSKTIYLCFRKHIHPSRLREPNWRPFPVLMKAGAKLNPTDAIVCFRRTSVSSAHNELKVKRNLNFILRSYKFCTPFLNIGD